MSYHGERINIQRRYQSIIRETGNMDAERPLRHALDIIIENEVPEIVYESCLAASSSSNTEENY